MDGENSKPSALTAFNQGGRFVTFYAGGLLFGAAINQVQEVLRPQALTRVPLAPSMISGLINLRGQIVTAINLRRRLQLGPREDGAAPMNVVLRAGEEPLDLLVDEIGDVVDVEAGAFERCPGNVSGAVKELIGGIYKLRGQLLLVLDVNAIV